MARDVHLIERLADPACYPGLAPDANVEILQTHISVVSLAGDLVYKRKKAVKLPFVDFSTLALRRHFCAEEVRLNRRLCPLVYHGVAELVEFDDGRLTFRGGTDDGPAGVEAPSGGTVVDVAVVMRRLPARRMLDEMLRHDAVTAADVAAIGVQMAKFHRVLPRSQDVARAGDPRRLAEFAAANFTETKRFVPNVFDASLHEKLARRTDADFAALLPALLRRRDDGHVVEGHGDLHARNICMTTPIAIYDCLEFDMALRCGDTATENAFLVMDLRYREQRALGDAYVDAYVAESGDDAQRTLLPPLVRYRAMVRAKVAALAAADTGIADAARTAAVASARRHMRLAAFDVVESDGPVVVVATGLPASGKSHFCAALTAETGWESASSDAIRKRLVGIAPTERAPQSAYSDATSDRVYAALHDAMREALRSGAPGFVLDANFATAARRAALREVLETAVPSARLVFVEVAVDEATTRTRMARRAQDPTAVSDADFAVYTAARARREPVRPDRERVTLIAVDGAVPVSTSLDVLAVALL